MESTQPEKSHSRFRKKHQQLLKGQFYTSAAVCDLMLALTLKTGEETLLEPGCGAGAFLMRAGDQLQSYFQRTPKQIKQQLYGVELDKNAYEQAKHNFKWMRLINQNFLSASMDTLRDEVGLFDVIIGNPPYVRHELLNHSEQMDKQHAYEYLTQKYAAYLAQFPKQKKLFSRKADLYVWFFLQSATLLKPGGSLAFITSNSWLNTAFGRSFCQFLLHQFDLCFLIESACERWFADASVNPVILVLNKKNPEQCNDIAPMLRVVRFYEPLSAWLPDSAKLDYWEALQNKLHEWMVPSVQKQSCYVRLISQSALYETLSDIPLETCEPQPEAMQNEQGFEKNWAFKMRAPDDWLMLLDQKNAWVSLGYLGKVRYPLKTGINRFFYLTREQAKNWEIEPQFLYPVVKSIRQVHTYQVTPADCDTLLFSCGLSEEKLHQKGYRGALQYIEWGKTQVSEPRQKRVQSVPWPQVASVQKNTPWYAIEALQPAHILCSRFWDRRFLFPVCQGQLMEDQTFYGLTLFKEYSPHLIAALLNSTWTWGLVEFGGRTNLGEGVLQFSREGMSALPLPHPDLYTRKEQQRIIDCFTQLNQRKVWTVADEVKCSVRQALDSAVLKPLLKKLAWKEDVKSFRESMVEHLLARMQERNLMARS